MLIGIGLGIGLPKLDDALDVGRLGLVSNPEDARAMLQAIAGGAIAVVSVTFTITVVALQLGSQQLSPRVLRTFQSNRLAQSVLAFLVGTFVLAILALGQVGTNSDTYVPGLSVVASIVAALASLGLFVAFVGDTVRSLQASHLIARIAAEGRQVLDPPYPGKLGREPEDAAGARAAAEARMAGEGVEVLSEGEGYLVSLRSDLLFEALDEAQAFARQCLRLGDFVLPGQALARIWCPGGAPSETVVRRVRESFEMDVERRVVSDTAFPLRQMVDVALRALSPSLNDPSTAESALNSVGGFLIHAARAERPSLIRLDEDDEPRFLADAPSLDDLVRLGFDQCRREAVDHPGLALRMVELLDAVRAEAERAETPCEEADRQIRLLEKAGRLA